MPKKPVWQEESPEFKYRLRWKLQARPNQLTPPGKWSNWLILAGRGWGKSRTGAEDVAYYGLNNPGCRIAIVAPTYAAARDICIEGESGLLTCLPDSCVGAGWNRSLGELKLKNGTIYKLYTSEKPDMLRGPQHHRAWCDELGSWNNGGTDTWDMLQMGLRLGKNPQNVITTTPKPLKIIRDLMKSKNTYLTTGSTYDNKANLAETFLDTILSKYEGTRLGQQELYAQLLDDTPGALWNRSKIEELRIAGDSEKIAQKCYRIVVAIDPSVTTGEDSDETGIIAVGIDDSGHGYVLADESCRGETPKAWAGKAINLLRRFKGDRIVGEVNNGGDLVEETIRVIDPNCPFKAVHASRGKYVRAEPISALYEQNKIHHVGLFEHLEDQMCSFTPDNIAKNSPDRADALVWACSDLFSGSLSFGFYSAVRESVMEEAVQKIAAKVAVSTMTKPVVSDNSRCACGSTSVVQIAGGFHCNFCGLDWRPAGLAKTFKPASRRDYLGI